MRTVVVHGPDPGIVVAAVLGQVVGTDLDAEPIGVREVQRMAYAVILESKVEASLFEVITCDLELRAARPEADVHHRDGAVVVGRWGAGSSPVAGKNEIAVVPADRKMGGSS